MLRATLTALTGAVVGLVFTSVLLWLTSVGINWGKSQTLQIDHWVIYLCMTLGAGFGALAGASIGLSPGTSSRN